MLLEMGVQLDLYWIYIAYRLYTVVPRLLQLIEELTNWYIRFNRKRLKGENGIEDADSAMRTLFEVLFTLCKMMVSQEPLSFKIYKIITHGKQSTKGPFTPFLAETMYQNLKTCLPSDPTVDTRSVHFLPFPSVKPEYFNDDVERAIGTMQRVIELGRYIRDKTSKPLKTPLRSLVYIHPDPLARADAQQLEAYILDELNIKTLTVTIDERAYGVRYELRPDHRTLGQRLGKEYAKLRKSLGGLSVNQVETFVTDKKLVVDGIELLENDFEVCLVFYVIFFKKVDHLFLTLVTVCQILRIFDDSNTCATTTKYEAKSEGPHLVIVDIAEDASLIQEGLAREIVNRVQRLRKKSGLVPTDDVLYYYSIVTDGKSLLKECLASQEEYLTRALKAPFITVESMAENAVVIAEEEQEVRDFDSRVQFIWKRNLLTFYSFSTD